MDHVNPDEDTKWYKPLLSFPDDIQPFVEDDPEDYMNGKKFSRVDFRRGPMYKVAGLNKSNLARADLSAFFVENDWRDQAVTSYSDIDLDTASLGSVVAWMEGAKAGKLKISQFNYIRIALAKYGWQGVLTIMDEHSDDLVLQMYGFHSFGKTFVPIDESGILTFVRSHELERKGH